MAYARDHWQSLLLPWFVPLLITGLAVVLPAWLSGQNLTMVFLLGVLFTATRTRLRPALLCALFSFMAYNFFFTEPRYSLRMLDEGEVLTATLLMLAALLTGQLAGRLKGQVDALRESHSWNDQQVACARDLAAAGHVEAIVQAVVHHLAESLAWHVREIEIDALPAQPRDSGPVVRRLDDRAGVTLLFCGDGGAVEAALRASAREPLNDWHQLRVATITNLAELAWTRVALADSLRRETLEKEREQLRSALLSSISHDLRTPLSTMIGSVSSLIDLADSLGSAERRELLVNTLSEARRLDRYIQKLLDMTRLGHGELSLDRDWVGLDDIIDVVQRRVEPLRSGRSIEVKLPRELPLLYVHPALLEQALFNVVENAIRFSPVGGTIGLTASVQAEWLTLDIHDDGPGIPSEDRARVFDMFHTFSYGDQYEAGTGLGLAICRSIIAAHGGDTSIADEADSAGTTVRIRLPANAAAAAGAGGEE